MTSTRRQVVLGVLTFAGFPTIVSAATRRKMMAPLMENFVEQEFDIKAALALDFVKLSLSVTGLPETPRDLVTEAFNLAGEFLMQGEQRGLIRPKA